jgi:hypothetical protein
MLQITGPSFKLSVFSSAWLMVTEIDIKLGQGMLKQSNHSVKNIPSGKLWWALLLRSFF